MPITAKLRHLRIAPRKVRLVADLIRGKSVEEAKAILSFTVKKGAGPVLKLLNSAVANAQHDFQVSLSSLYISKLVVDEGSKLKRWRPRARGRAAPIQKKTSHIFLSLDSRGGKISKKIIKKPIIKKAEPEEAEVRALEKEKPKSDKDVKAIRPKKSPKEFRKPKLSETLGRVFKRKAF